MLLRLAWRNLMGAGMRTALNVSVLSITFVAIVGTLGLLEGFNRQTSRAMIEGEYGGGQYRHPQYDPLDPISLPDAHGVIPRRIQRQIDQGLATAVLAMPGTMYPGGRLRSVVIKGVNPSQRLLAMPASSLGAAADADEEEIPALIGTRMARATGLKTGDIVTLQWKDATGTIDARDARIVEVMHTTVQSIDVNQVWVPLSTLQALASMPGEASLVVLARGAVPVENGGWPFKSADELLVDVRQLIQSKAAGSAIVYLLLLFLSMLAIFDTQVLAIFRRRREIGTLVALGMTRGRVIRLFTIEGALHGVLAVLAGAAWGLPLLWWFSVKGWALSSLGDDYGFAIGSTLYPYYSPRLVIVTMVLLLMVTAIVSYLPTRRIASLEPTDALRGRLM
jgi:ABC-type lipoprotein release transport system permease subunit